MEYKGSANGTEETVQDTYQQETMDDRMKALRQNTVEARQRFDKVSGTQTQPELYLVETPPEGEKS